MVRCEVQGYRPLTSVTSTISEMQVKLKKKKSSVKLFFSNNLRLIRRLLVLLVGAILSL